MKVTVRNLGVLKDEATIDLKPLTIFIGPNNSGKTWLAYALAGILGPYGADKYAQAYSEGQVSAIYEPLNSSIEQLINQGTTTLDLYEFANRHGEIYFNEVAKFARTWMNDFLGTQLGHFEDMDIALSLDERKEFLLERIYLYRRLRNITIGPMKASLEIRKRRDENTMQAYTTVEVQDIEEQEEQEEKIPSVGQIASSIPSERIRRELSNFTATALHRSLYTHVRVFPTERTMLITARFDKKLVTSEISSSNTLAKALETAFEAITRDDTLAKELKTLSERNTGRRGSWPVGSFIRMLSDIFDTDTRKREAREQRANSKYIELAQILEEQIFNGGIEFSTSDPDPKRELLFHPLRDVDLEIPITSSMVKELSPLVLYLRYLAEPEELLIIDEPEMNLHPEAQVKILEFLAMLVNAGLNVLFTTHSPYITDHLTNLIKASEREDKESVRDDFFLKSTDAFITRDKVAVYNMEAGKVVNALDEEGFITVNTFGKITEQISDIFFKL